MENITIRIFIESKLACLPLIRKTIRSICSTLPENEKFFQDIDLSLTEALSNIIHHAYQNESNHEIQIKVNLSQKEVVFEIVDVGLKRPYISADPPNENLNDINSLLESGRGVSLIHKLMDIVTYKREKDKNILILHKHLH